MISRIPIGTRQAVILGLTSVVVAIAAGFGIVSVLDTSQQPADLDPATLTNQPAPTPPTETPAGTTTSRTTTQATLSPTLQFSLSGFEDVRNTQGTVSTIEGTVSGTVDWQSQSTVDRVELVVRTWAPERGWAAVEKATVRPTNAELSLADAIGGTRLVYATGDRARAFDNPTDGTVLVREGHVAVTAVLYADGEVVGRTQSTESFSFEVTNTAETSSTNSDGRPDLVLRGSGADPTVVDAENVAPGVRGSGRLTLANEGADDEELSISATNLGGAENGITDPESRVDSDEASELPPNLLVRVSLHDGESVEYVVGGPARMAAFGSLSAGDLGVSSSLAGGEEVTLLVEWYVVPSAGNEIQSDGVSFDFELALADVA